jgi:ABC-type branched-subunit amino acid transport system substrate-binding protein
MPIISITAGSAYLDDRGGELIYRETPSDTLLGRPQPLYALDQGWETMAIAYLDNEGAQSFARSAGNFYESQGGELVEEVTLPPQVNSYRSEIGTITDADPDVVLVEASEDGMPLFIQNWVEQGVDLPLMAGIEGSQQTIIDQVGADAMEGVYGVSNVPGSNYDAFAELFEEEYGEEPGIFAPESFDALNLAALAWERAGSVGPQAFVDNVREIALPDGTQVGDFPSGKEELEAGNEIDYQGAATECNFDEDGDVYGAIAVTRAQDGEWAEIEVFDQSELNP